MRSERMENKIAHVGMRSLMDVCDIRKNKNHDYGSVVHEIITVAAIIVHMF